MASGFLDNGVTAHRGNSFDYPQNTIAAFESAIEIGADWIELDVHLTADGQLVVIHDYDTASVAEEKVVIAEASYAELKKLDAGYRFRAEHGLAVEQCPKASLPLLSEVLALVRSQGRTRVSIQPKVDCVAEVVDAIKKADAGLWSGFNDGHLEYMSLAKKLLPEAHIFWDRYKADIEQDVDIAKELGFESIVVYYEDLRDEDIALIKGAGIEVGVWTINEPVEMREFLGRGVYRIYTDNPVGLLKLKG